jgi:hypothetical protein
MNESNPRYVGSYRLSQAPKCPARGWNLFSLARHNNNNHNNNNTTTTTTNNNTTTTNSTTLSCVEREKISARTLSDHVGRVASFLQQRGQHRLSRRHAERIVDHDDRRADTGMAWVPTRLQQRGKRIGILLRRQSAVVPRVLYKSISLTMIVDRVGEHSGCT